MMLNRENQTEFEEYLREHQDMNLGIDLTVDVINQIFWPSYKSFNLNLPLEMVRIHSMIWQLSLVSIFSVILSGQ